MSAIFVLLAHMQESQAQWQEGKGHRFFPVDPKGSGTGFTRLLPEQTGLSFTNLLSIQAVARNRVTENGSGVALGDVDGDGLCDIFFAGLENDSALYRNLGHWKFEDVTASSGLALPNELTTGAAFADLDGDGDLDLLANALPTGTRAFLNDGKGKFTEMQNKLARRFAATSMSLADIDQDHDLDLYVTTYRSITFKDEVPPVRAEARRKNGQIVITPEGRFAALSPTGGNVQISELGERDFMYVNMGKGQFGSVSWTNGTFLGESGQRLETPQLDWGLSVLLRDLNDDGFPDIYVCNDFFYSADRIFLNQGNNTFKAIARESITKISLASMAVDVADINRDGFDDIFVAEMLSRDLPFRQTHRENMDRAAMNGLFTGAEYRPEVPRNTLFLNRGDGTYAEIAEFAGVDASEWSWGAIFLDVDLDGYEDLIIPTGNNTDVQHADGLIAVARDTAPDSEQKRVRNLRRLGQLRTPIMAFRNQRDLTFAEAGDQWGFKESGIVNGMACADLDNDGDLDLVGNALNGSATVYRNGSPAPRVGIRVRAKGENTQGIGAKITLLGGPVPQSQTLVSGGRYLSHDDAMRVFATSTNPLSANIRWPDGTESTHRGLLPNHVYEIAQPATSNRFVKFPTRPPRFEEVALNHRHLDESFDDYARQPLLPAKLSNYGPGISCFDLDGDGFDEIIIPAGTQGTMAIFKNNAGKFAADTNRFPLTVQKTDQTSILPLPQKDGSIGLLIGQSNYETASAQIPAVSLLKGNAPAEMVVPGNAQSVGPMSMADIDRDGDLDLFVGYRVLPGRYPQGGPGKIYLNTEGKFEEASTAPSEFKSLGMVTAAAFADLDGNSWPDLIVACDLGPIKVFLNNSGLFTDATASLGFSSFVGHWNSLAISDFDNDGKLDLIAGNLGSNHKNRRHDQKPTRVYHGDLTLDGTFDIIEAYYNPALQKYCPWQDLDSLTKAAPELKQQGMSFAQFSVSGMDELFPQAQERLAFVEVTSTASALFLNRGSTFEHRLLPAPAQFAPVYGIALADFDGDGNEDAFLAQNNSQVRWDQGALDAGSGLLLLGDGKGQFKPEWSIRTGLSILGDGRGAASLDFDLDGRPDLVVGQNNGATKLYRNGAAAQGVTLSFTGSPVNPLAIGTEVQLIREAQPQRKRLLSCGNGYASQSSVQQTWRIIPGDRFRIKWPDGKHSEITTEQIARSRVIDYNTAIKR